MLLVAGGDQDPQIARFRARLDARGVPHRALLHGVNGTPPVVWDLEAGGLCDETGPIAISAAFVRQDVFRFLETNRPIDRDDGRSWKVLMDAVLGADPSIRIFNRAFAGKDGVNKPLALLWAKEAGLAIPKTVIHASKAKATEMLAAPTIYKPIAGGDMCRALEAEALEKVKTRHLPRPYIFQERLEAPELRVFRVGDDFFGFDVAADALDYRTVGGAAKITPVAVPDHLLAPLRTLSNRVGLTYAAADFKMSPEDGQFRFLEINSNPMFAAFDMAAEGGLVDAMIDHLIG